MEEMAVIKRDGKLYVDAFDGTGENIVTAEHPSESGRARKYKTLHWCLSVANAALEVNLITVERAAASYMRTDQALASVICCCLYNSHQLNTLKILPIENLTLTYPENHSHCLGLNFLSGYTGLG